MSAKSDLGSKNLEEGGLYIGLGKSQRYSTKWVGTKYPCQRSWHYEHGLHAGTVYCQALEARYLIVKYMARERTTVMLMVCIKQDYLSI